MQKFLRAQFSNFLRGDVEHEQALIRCAILSIVSLYLWITPHEGPLLPFSPRFVSIAYLILSIPLFIWVAYRPGRHQLRKISFTILDQLLIAYAVSFGEHTVPIIAIAFWVIIGSAFRYGQSYLYLSAGTAVLGILYNIYFSPEWAAYTIYGWGYLISILIVVFYTMVFLARASETNRKLNESLEHFSTLARADSLTGLPNRLALVERLTQSIAMTKRQRTYVSLLYFDLDEFKTINDTLGHNQGDALLKEVAQKITSRIRNTDMLARLGGDEFIIVLEGTRMPQDSILVASTVLETIRGITINGERHFTDNQVTLHTSASIGIATYGPDISPTAPSVDEFIQRADDAMYIAKQAGKGCYRFWTEHLAMIQPADSLAGIGINTGNFNFLSQH